MGRKYDALAASLLSGAEFYEACAKDYERAASDDRSAEQRATSRGKAYAFAGAARYMRTMLKTSSPVARNVRVDVEGFFVTPEEVPEHPARHDLQYCIPVAWAGALLDGVDLNDERAVRRAFERSQWRVTQDGERIRMVDVSREPHDRG